MKQKNSFETQWNMFIINIVMQGDDDLMLPACKFFMYASFENVVYQIYFIR